MQVHDLTPNTPEWLAYRLAHFNASDAPAMMGVSPHKTRDQLIHQLFIGGDVVEVDRFTQRRFDAGHLVEDVSRQAAGNIAGTDFAPVVASEGTLSASYDGMDFTETVAWENKNLSAELRAIMSAPGFTTADLPACHLVQMEHQCAVCPTLERVLFTGSELLADGTLGEVLHCWFTPDLARRAEVLAGWQQLEADVAAYTPVEVVERAVARVMVDLPVPAVEVRGEITLTSDLARYETIARQFIARIPARPETDQEFADAKEGAKKLRDAAKRVRENNESVLARITSVGEFTRTADALADVMDAAALGFEKAVKAQETAVREKICLEGKVALDEYVAELNAGLGKIYLRNIAADFALAIKGKRTIESVQNAKNVALATAKIAAANTATVIRTNLALLAPHKQEFAQLFPDEAVIVLKAADDFSALVQFRVADQRAKDRKRADDLAEQARETIRQEERDRAQRGERERAAGATPAPAPEPAAAPGAPGAPAAIVPSPAPAPTVFQMVARAQPTPAAAISAEPTVTLGQIGTRLGFSLTADFLRSLGFEGERRRAALLFHEHDYPRICDALIAHVTKAKQPAAA